FARGLQFQGDYTFSKALTDAPDQYGNNQSDLGPFRALRNRRLDYRRSNWDQTHRFVFNAVCDLPVGSNRATLDVGGILNQVIGGWTLGSIVTWQTSLPFFISSNRATFNNFNPMVNPAQLTGITFEEFKRNVGVYRRPEGVFFINPNLLD